MRTRCILTITALILAGASVGLCQTDQLPQQQPAPQPQQPNNSTQQSNTGGQQSVTPGQPIPAINPSTGPVQTTESQPSQGQLPPLAGAEAITPELPGSTHSYILPSFSVWEAVDSNPYLQPGVRKSDAATIPTGTVDLTVAGRANQFSLNFTGGGLIYDSALSQTAGYVAGGFTDTYTTRRWSFLFSDRVSYLPQAAGGFGGLGFGGAFNNAPMLGAGSGPTQLNPIFTPGQSVLTGQFAALSNSAIAQAQYQINTTNSVSVTGSFGIQHYSAGTGLQSGNDTLAVFGWDHQLSPGNSISVSYSLIKYAYNGGLTSISDNVWRVGYGRRVSHRMAFTALVGPQLIYSANRLVPGVQRSLSVTGQASLSYQLQRVSFTLGYSHFTTPGSGVFEGANTDNVTGGAAVQVTRTWTLSLSGANSRNTGLGAFSVNPAFPNPGAINYQYGSVRITHVMGRYMKAFLVYNLQHQASGGPVVPGSTGTGLIQNVFGIGLAFNPRPVGL